MEKLLAQMWSSPGSAACLLSMPAWQPTFATVFGLELQKSPLPFFSPTSLSEEVQSKPRSTESSIKKGRRGRSRGVVCMPGPTLLAAKERAC